MTQVDIEREYSHWRRLNPVDEAMIMLFRRMQQTYEIIAEVLGEDCIEEDE